MSVGRAHRRRTARISGKPAPLLTAPAGSGAGQAEILNFVTIGTPAGIMKIENRPGCRMPSHAHEFAHAVGHLVCEGPWDGSEIPHAMECGCWMRVTPWFDEEFDELP